DQSLKLLYDTKVDGISLNKVFERYIKDKDMHETLTPKIVNQTFNKYYKNANFELINDLENVFDTDTHFRKFLDLGKIYFENHWILKLDTKISRSSKLEFKDSHESYLGHKDSLHHKGFFKRRSLTKKFIKNHSMTLGFMTHKKTLDKTYLKTLVKSDKVHQYILENIHNLDKYFFQFNALNNDQKTFLKMVLFDPVFQNIEDISKLRTYLFDAFYSGYLEEFIANNQKHLYIINEYKEKLTQLEFLMHEKMQL